MSIAALVVLIVCGLLAVAFTIVPLIPGSIFVLVGAGAILFADDTVDLSWWFWAGQALLLVIYLVLDNIVQVKALAGRGASKWALVGATVGVIAGAFLTAPVLGPLAVVLGPPIGAVAGAVAGEVFHRRRMPDLEEGAQRPRLLHIGAGSLVAYVVGTALKLVIVAVQITWLALAILR